jgi:hypothetical protein
MLMALAMEDTMIYTVAYNPSGPDIVTRVRLAEEAKRRRYEMATTATYVCDAQDERTALMIVRTLRFDPSRIKMTMRQGVPVFSAVARS